MAESTDPLFEAIHCLKPMIDSFRKSLSKLCKDEKNAGALALGKDLEEYYSQLYKDLISRYEAFKKREINSGIIVPENHLKGKKNRQVEKEFFAEYSLPKVLPVNVRSQIESLCKIKDGSGLISYIFDNRKEDAALRVELPAALDKTPNAANLVLKALDGYYSSGSDSTNRSAFILLLECLFPVLGSDENAFIAKEVRSKAKEIARFWSQKMGLDKNVELASGLNVQAFLQLLVTFRIAKDYGQERLCELLMRIESKRQSPELAKFLGLTNKMPDFVDKLSQTGNWLEALRYAHAFGMMDKVKPADLLKAYMEDAEKAAQDILKRGEGSSYSLRNSTTKEISALNMVIKVVNAYNLQNVFPLDELQSKLNRLERVIEITKNNVELQSKLNRLERITKNNVEIVKRKRQRKVKQMVKERKMKAAATEADEKKKAVETEADEKKKASATKDIKDDVAEKAQLKRPRYTDPGDDIARSQVPTDLGLYRPSQRAKYTSRREKIASEQEKNRATGDKDTIPYNIGHFQNNHGTSRDDHHFSSYRGDNRSAVGPPIYGSGHAGAAAPLMYGKGHVGAVVPPSSIATQNSDRRGSDGLTIAFGSGNINSVVTSLYGSSATTGPLALSAFSPAQVKYDGRSLQSHNTTAFGGVDKSCAGSSMYGFGALTNTSSRAVQSNYERRGPEQNTSAFGGGNLSNTGSSAYRSSALTVQSSDLSSRLDRRGLEQYMPTLGVDNIYPIDLSVYGGGGSTVSSSNLYGFGASPVPLSNIAHSNFEIRGPEQHQSGHGSSNRLEYGSAGLAGGLREGSAIYKYQFNSGLRS